MHRLFSTLHPAKRLIAWLIAAVLLCGAAMAEENPTLEHEGTSYRLKSGLTTVLLAGTDHYSNDRIDAIQHRRGGQADFLLLLVLDSGAETITPIQIDRDTMTPITTLNVMGRVSGSRVAQICLAHSFGDGGQYSSELLCRAVSKYLGGIPVDYYFTLNLDGIAEFNDALGGVEVTLRDDFSHHDPEMTAGKTMVLRGRQAQIFLQERFYVGEETNVSRQQRQWDYLYAAKDALMNKLSQNIFFIGDLLDLLDEYMVTNMGAVDLLSHAARAIDYEILPICSVDGVHANGEDGFVEFTPDADELMRLILNTFYDPET